MVRTFRIRVENGPCLRTERRTVRMQFGWWFLFQFLCCFVCSFFFFEVPEIIYFGRSWQHMFDGVVFLFSSSWSLFYIQYLALTSISQHIYNYLSAIFMFLFLLTVYCITTGIIIIFGTSIGTQSRFLYDICIYMNLISCLFSRHYDETTQPKCSKHRINPAPI